LYPLVKKFGPIDKLVQSMAENLFDENGIIQPWYFVKLGTLESEKILIGAGEGAFLIRPSESKPDRLVLCTLSKGSVIQKYIFPG